MAITLPIVGPARVLIGGSDTVDGSTVSLGLSDQEELPQYEIIDLGKEVFCVDTGDEPQEIINTGRVAIVSIALVKWDFGLLATHFRSPGGTTEGACGVIGSLWFKGNYARKVIIAPVGGASAANPGYAFDRCVRLDPYRVEKFGNDSRRLIVTFRAYRFPGLGAETDWANGASTTQACMRQITTGLTQ